MALLSLTRPERTVGHEIGYDYDMKKGPDRAAGDALERKTHSFLSLSLLLLMSI